MGAKYPNIKVKLTGRDGNAFAIIGSVNAAMRQAGIKPNERDLFLQEAMSGDYNNLLRTTMKWVTVT